MPKHQSKNGFTILTQEIAKPSSKSNIDTHSIKTNLKNHSSLDSDNGAFVEKYQQALKQYQSDLQQQSYVHKKRLITYDSEIKLR